MNYLLIGPEEYLKFQFLERLKKAVLKTDQPLQADLDIFGADEKEFARILDALRTQPFMSRKRLVIIKDVDKLSAKAKDSILKYLNTPKDSTVLVLESPSNKFDRFLNEVARFAKTVRCNRLNEKEINLWIKKEFAIRKKHISLSCANLLRELAGEDLFLLKNEMAKIASFVGNDREISELHVEAVLGTGPYKTAFELVDLVLEKRLDKVLQSLDGLLTREKPHGILNLLAWQFRNFIKLKNLPERRSLEDISQALDINPRFAKKVLEQEKRFTRKELEENLEIILEADLSMKRGKVDSRHALERALVLLHSSV